MTSAAHAGSPFAIDPLRDARWDAFIHSHPRASVHHLAAWAEILASQRYRRPVYLATEDRAGALTGVLPLVYVRRLLGGARISALPVVRARAGPLGNGPDEERALLETACRLTRERGADVLMLRSDADDLASLAPALERLRERPAIVLDLPGDPDELMRRWRRNFRRDVRVGERAPLDIREGSGEEDLKRFYRLHLLTMKKHRALPHPWPALEREWRGLAPQGAIRLVLAEHRGRPVAAGVFHLFRDEIELIHNASDPRALHLHPNHAMYWWTIRWAIERGLRVFDMGPGVGSQRWFKERWGGEPDERYRYTYVPGGDAGATERFVDVSWRRQVLGRELGDLAPVAWAWERTPVSLTPLVARALEPLF